MSTEFMPLIAFELSAGRQDVSDMTGRTVGQFHR
jgi:hypothetical protein